MEDLIENAHMLFQFDERERGQGPGRHPSPPTQLQFPTSQHQSLATEQSPPMLPLTSLTQAPPRSAVPQHDTDAWTPKSPAHYKAASTSSATPPARDFTPELPPRPANSIHPSARKPDAPLSPLATRPRPPSMPPPAAEAPQKTSPPRSRPPSMPPPQRLVMPQRDSLISFDSDFTGDAVAAMAFTREEVTQVTSVPRSGAPQHSASGQLSRPATPSGVDQQSE
jgi:hypothetical protein